MCTPSATDNVTAKHEAWHNYAGRPTSDFRTSGTRPDHLAVLRGQDNITVLR